jgi:hypothetical protein
MLADEPQFTAYEVKRALRRPIGDRRGQAIHDCLARLGAHLNDQSIRRRFRGLEDYHQRLLRILTLYCRGADCAGIANELSLFSTAIGVEQAIETAATIIADQLNGRLAA